MILLSHRFYVNSIFEILEGIEMPFFVILETVILNFWSISVVKRVHKFIKSKFRASKCFKMARFALIEKIWNFHTVERLPLNQTSLLFSRTQQLAIDDNESSNDGSKPKNFLPDIFFHLFRNWMPVSKIAYQSLRKNIQ